MGCGIWTFTKQSVESPTSLVIGIPLSVFVYWMIAVVYVVTSSGICMKVQRISFMV